MANQTTKPETRNQKPESSPNPQTRLEIRNIRHSDFRFDSSFGFRHSNFRARGSDFRARGFTLIEMITVLSIIIIVLAIAIPVWNALLGGTNLVAAQNQVSAVLANARADAIYNRQTIGVFFYIDPKTQQTAMAEVQVQTSWIGGSTGSYTPLFTPNLPGGPPPNNGQVNQLELVNSIDATGNRNFYRDVVLLPKGVGVVLNNDTYQNNLYAQWTPATNMKTPGNLDRYVHLGCIMFNPDGTLASIPYGIKFQETLTGPSPSSPATVPPPTDNLLCQKIGMVYTPPAMPWDVGSIVPAGGTPALVPLLSSVGLVIYDHDLYLNQHANPTTIVTTATGQPFSDFDLESQLFTLAYPSGTPIPAAADKFLEEQWIDQNGTAMMVSPFNGSLIKAK